jgi:hypothetical protein
MHAEGNFQFFDPHQRHPVLGCDLGVSLLDMRRVGRPGLQFAADLDSLDPLPSAGMPGQAFHSATWCPTRCCACGPTHGGATAHPHDRAAAWRTPVTGPIAVREFITWIRELDCGDPMPGDRATTTVPRLNAPAAVRRGRHNAAGMPAHPRPFADPPAAPAAARMAAPPLAPRAGDAGGGAGRGAGVFGAGDQRVGAGRVRRRGARRQRRARPQPARRRDGWTTPCWTAPRCTPACARPARCSSSTPTPLPPTAAAWRCACWASMRCRSPRWRPSCCRSRPTAATGW